MHRLVRPLVLVSALLLAAGVARADDFGEFGTPAALEIATSSADTYLQFHGRLFVRNANGGLDEYRWGGTSCGTRVLTEAQVAALQAVVDNKKMQIQMTTQTGQGNSMCVVGFRQASKKYAKLLAP